MEINLTWNQNYFQKSWLWISFSKPMKWHKKFTLIHLKWHLIKNMLKMIMKKMCIIMVMKNISAKKSSKFIKDPKIFSGIEMLFISMIHTIILFIVFLITIMYSKMVLDIVTMIFQKEKVILKKDFLDLLVAQMKFSNNSVS